MTKSCPNINGPYSVMVSTELCGSSGSGSNPDKDPNRELVEQKLHFVPLLLGFCPVLIAYILFPVQDRLFLKNKSHNNYGKIIKK